MAAFPFIVPSPLSLTRIVSGSKRECEKKEFRVGFGSGHRFTADRADDDYRFTLLIAIRS